MRKCVCRHFLFNKVYVISGVLSVSAEVCEVAPRSLFWVPSGLNELLEVCFEFRIELIGQSQNVFFTGQSWHVLNSCHTARGTELGFQRQ